MPGFSRLVGSIEPEASAQATRVSTVELASVLWVDAQFVSGCFEGCKACLAKMYVDSGPRRVPNGVRDQVGEFVYRCSRRIRAHEPHLQLAQPQLAGQIGGFVGVDVLSFVPLLCQPFHIPYEREELEESIFAFVAEPAGG